MTINKAITVAFTGCKTAKTISPLLNSQDIQSHVIKTLTVMIEELYRQGYRTFLSGMTEGFDLWAALAVIFAKNQFPDIQLMAVIPFPGQEAAYSSTDKKVYKYIMKHATQQIIISPSTDDDAHLKRDNLMLSNASHLVCYYDGQPGSTMYLVNRAKEHNMSVTNIYK